MRACGRLITLFCPLAQEQLVSVEVKIDNRVHNRIIGQKGKSVRKIMDDFKVDIRFPRDPTDDTVTITGSEDAVEDCEEHLLMLEEEYVSFKSVFVLFNSLPKFVHF